ncbi:hypothetical protein [Salinicoccus roseus]|uniref:hypothetical protein n=1 Tax=Salinicoccus roseus TaxID=45670 RepID=UPI0015CDB62E|nr:hypothetical protein [Salinicoccus roseus]
MNLDRTDKLFGLFLLLNIVAIFVFNLEIAKELLVLVLVVGLYISFKSDEKIPASKNK